MSQQANKFKLGLFVITGSLLLIFILILVGMRSVFEHGVIVETACDTSVQGLDIGSPVKFRGVKIGSVSEIGLVWDYYPEIKDGTRPYIIIRSEIDKDFVTQSTRGTDFQQRLKDSVDKGMRIQLTSQGLTGLSYLEVDLLDPERHPPPDISWEPANPYIPSAPARITAIAESLEMVAQKLEKIDIDGIAVEFNELLRDTNNQINAIQFDKLSGETSDALVEIRETGKRIRELLEKPETQQIPDNVLAALDDIKAVTDEAKTRTPEVMEELTLAAKEVSAAATDLREIVNSDDVGSGVNTVKETAENAKKLTEEMNKTITRLNGSLLKIELLLSEEQENVHEVLENLARVSDNLNETTDLIRRYPSLLLFGKPPEPLEAAE